MIPETEFSKACACVEVTVQIPLGSQILAFFRAAPCF